MPHHGDDRRVQRTRRLIQDALFELIDEMGYEKITVQDIVDRANVGRTTFYAHYRSKDDVFVRSHDHLVHLIALELLGEQDAFESAPSPRLIESLRQMQQDRTLYLVIKLSKGSADIFGGLRRELTESIEMLLNRRYDPAESAVPFAVLAAYLSGAMLNIIVWWLDTQSHIPPEALARMIHRLQMAAIRDVLPGHDHA